jgi:hypothetical protein
MGRNVVGTRTIPIDYRLRALARREAFTRKDILGGKNINENIHLNNTVVRHNDASTGPLGNFIHELEESSGPEAWARSVQIDGDQVGNHNLLEYWRDHIIPYLRAEVPVKPLYFGRALGLMSRMINLAARQTNYWAYYNMVPNNIDNNNFNSQEARIRMLQHENPAYEARMISLRNEFKKIFRTGAQWKKCVQWILKFIHSKASLANRR